MTDDLWKLGQADLITKIKRQQKKIARRDQKIKGLQRRVQNLESQVASRTIDFPRTVEQAVTDALCNVRMIPVFRTAKSDRITVDIQRQPRD